MNSVYISGVIIDDQIYVNTNHVGLYLPMPSNPEEHFTIHGWWFPTENVRMLTDVLDTGKDNLRHEEITYAGTLIRAGGEILDVKLAGPNYRLVSTHSHRRVVVIPEDKESSLVSTFIEHLALNPDLDPENGNWTIERIEKICSVFPGNNRFVPFMKFSELVAKLDENGTVPFAEFPRSENKKDYF